MICCFKLPKEETDTGTNDKVSAEALQHHDEYISEKSGAKPAGLYRAGQDENGRRRIFFDDPKKSGHGDEKRQSVADGESSRKGGDGGPLKISGTNPDKSPEKCTGNTDKVDREIRQLKEKKKLLEQQIQSASEEEGKVRELEKKLTQVENELSRKDNDMYRRQNTVFQNRTNRCI